MSANRRGRTIEDSLISFAFVCCTDGNNNNILIKATHATAIAPIRLDHRPRENDPGTNLWRPDVIRRKMGVA